MRALILMALIVANVSLGMESSTPMQIDERNATEEIILFNLGGYPFDVPKNTILESDIDLLKLICGQEFRQKKIDNRFFVGCSPKMGEIIASYACGALFPGGDITLELIDFTAKFFCCKSLEALVKKAKEEKEAKALEEKYKILTITPNESKYFISSSGVEIFLCPLTQKPLSKFGVTNHNCLDDVICHLISGHMAQIDNIFPRNGGFLLNFKYKSEDCGEPDTDEFSIRVCRYYHEYVRCPYCDGCLILNQRHMESCNAEFLFSGTLCCVVRYKKK